MADPSCAVPVLSREDLDNIPSRPQLWGKQIETVDNGIRLRIRIPANYGSGEVNSRWPVVIFLKDTRGFIEENLDPDDSYVHDKTYTNMAPFVTISPYVSDSAFVWNSDTIFKMQNVLLDLRHILFISVRRVYLIGIGSGAHAALKWSLQYPLMFAAIVLVSPHFVDGAVAQSDAECSPDDVQDRSTTVLDDETEAGFNENHVKITTTTPSWRVCTSVEEMKRIITILPVDESLLVARKTARLTVLRDKPRPKQTNAATDCGTVRSPADSVADVDGEKDADLRDEETDEEVALKAERKELLRSAQLYSWLLEFSQPINLGAQSKVESMAPRLSALSLNVMAMGDSAIDVYGAGVGLQKFETSLANHLGKRAGLFCLSGTCANQVAVQTAADCAKSEQGAAMHKDDVLATSPSNASFRRSELYSSGTHGALSQNRSALVQQKARQTVLVHWTSHLVHLSDLSDGTVQREQFSRLAQYNFFGLQVVPFGVMHKVTSYSDVKARLQDESWSPAAIVIEIPQRMNGGATIAFDDLRQLRSVCTRKGIHMHMDGARLWEAQPYYGRSISDLCAQFDSVYVSFYKGLGAMAGAMLCGSEAFIDAAREWRHRLGGQPFTFSPAWIDCKHRFELHKDSFQKRFDHLCGVVDTLKNENIVYPKGLIRFVPEVPQSCMVHVYIGVPAEIAVEAHRRAQRRTHVQLWNRIRGCGFPAYQSEMFNSACYFEWTIGDENMKIEHADVVEGWSAFLNALEELLCSKGIVPPRRPTKVAAVPSQNFIQKQLVQQWLSGETTADIPKAQSELMVPSMRGSMNFEPETDEDTSDTQERSFFSWG